MNYSNQSADELARTAEHENNSLALAIIDADTTDDTDQIEDMVQDIANHFIGEIDEKLSDYIRDYYLNPESDYFDFLFMFASENPETDELKRYYDGSDCKVPFDVIIDRLDCMLDYYCEVETSQNYSASRGISITSACIGEIEESLDLINDMFPAIFSDTEIADRVTAAIKAGISTVFIHDKSDLIYIDMSDTFASLVIKSDMIDELFAPEE